MSATKRGLALLTCLVALAILLPAGAGAHPFLLGFFDTEFAGANAPAWLQRGAAAGADMVRIDIGWDAPNTARRPTGFDARNPADPHYGFSAADAAIRDATARGLRVLAVFTGAPQWAQGPRRPADAPLGTWRPDPSALQDYGAALAERYSGHFPDPANPGHDLPRVAAFQVWNEPNLSQYLTPQYVGTQAVAPGIYRNMLNAFYRGVKSVDRRALVVTAGTAPFGDPPGGLRTPPVVFWSDLLCLRGPAGHPSRAGCADPPHFDVMAHHPYSVGSPTTSALNPGDVSIPDLGKLTTLLRAAQRLSTALPRESHPLWITETSYNSYPPDPGGVPINEQAHWLEQALALLWRGGAQAVFWNQVGDQSPIPSYAATAQSGVYYLSGKPKPALSAFRFPLVGWRAGSGIDVWGRSPVAGRVAIQEQLSSRWRTVRTLNEPAHSVFMVRIAGGGAVRLRGSAGGQTSLVWQLR